jgi:hypothetical protein
VLCCSSVKDRSGYSPSSRRAPSQNSQQRCYTSLRLCALEIFAVTVVGIRLTNFSPCPLAI